MTREQADGPQRGVRLQQARARGERRVDERADAVDPGGLEQAAAEAGRAGQAGLRGVGRLPDAEEAERLDELLALGGRARHGALGHEAPRRAQPARPPAGSTAPSSGQRRGAGLVDAARGRGLGEQPVDRHDAPDVRPSRRRQASSAASSASGPPASRIRSALVSTRIVLAPVAPGSATCRESSSSTSPSSSAGSRRRRRAPRRPPPPRPPSGGRAAGSSGRSRRW